MAETSNRKTYHEQTYIDNTLRLREILKTLPPFAKDYFRAVEPTTSARTRILMPMISVFSFISLWRIIRFIKIILSNNLRYMIWNAWSP